MTFTKTLDLPNYNGYSLDHRLNNDEILLFKNSIQKRWFETINNVDENLGRKIIKKNIDIINYHEISNLLDHSLVWRKSSRIMPSSFVNRFLESDFAHDLKEKYGEYTISDEEHLGRPNIYWRLVRPNEPQDVGPMHRDSWFWSLNKNFPKPKYKFHRLKVWIAIFVEKGLNGLKVEPASQYRKDIKWAGEKRHGIEKPILITPPENIKSMLIETDPGQAIVFNDDLLHGGSLNKGKYSRVSVEFTMLIRD